MSVIGSAAAPLITQAGLAVLARPHRAALSANSGRAVLRIDQTLPGGDYVTAVDDHRDQAARRSSQLARFDQLHRLSAEAKDPTMAAFVTECREIWGRYDEAELVMCLITAGATRQVLLVPKPWANGGAAPHEHCACGLRAGSDPRHDEEHFEIVVVDAALEALAELLEAQTGAKRAAELVAHARNVLVHVYGALHSGDDWPEVDRLAAYLGAACCVADGHTGVERCRDPELLLGNTEKVLSVLCDGALAGYLGGDHAALLERVAQNVARSRLDVPDEDGERARTSIEDYARAAVWLESMGAAGIQRYGAHYRRLSLPMVAPGTPFPTTESGVFDQATPKRRAAWRAGGKSASLVDHYYDELLHRHEELVRHPNKHFSRCARARGAAMVKLCMMTRGDAVASKIR